jgi:hypothetical protein
VLMFLCYWLCEKVLWFPIFKELRKESIYVFNTLHECLVCLKLRKERPSLCQDWSFSLPIVVKNYELAKSKFNDCFWNCYFVHGLVGLLAIVFCYAGGCSTLSILLLPLWVMCILSAWFVLMTMNVEIVIRSLKDYVEDMLKDFVGLLDYVLLKYEYWLLSMLSVVRSYERSIGYRKMRKKPSYQMNPFDLVINLNGGAVNGYLGLCKGAEYRASTDAYAS